MTKNDPKSDRRRAVNRQSKRQRSKSFEVRIASFERRQCNEVLRPDGRDLIDEILVMLICHFD